MFLGKKRKYSYRDKKPTQTKKFSFSAEERRLVLNMLRRGIVASGKFTIHDVAQQVIGAIILSAPFVVTQEVWELARLLNPFRIVILFLLTIFVGVSILHYTRTQSTANGKKELLKRMVSLMLVSYSFSFFVLYTVGIIGNVITDAWWAFRLVVLVSLFSSIGAATADILIFK